MIKELLKHNLTLLLKSNSIVKDAKSYVEQFGYEAVQAI